MPEIIQLSLVGLGILSALACAAIAAAIIFVETLEWVENRHARITVAEHRDRVGHSCDEPTEDDRAWAETYGIAL